MIKYSNFLQIDEILTWINILICRKQIRTGLTEAESMQISCNVSQDTCLRLIDFIHNFYYLYDLSNTNDIEVIKQQKRTNLYLYAIVILLITAILTL